YTGPSDSSNVQQSPPGLLKSPGQSAEINCSHTITGYDRILWYKQSGRGGAWMFIGYLYTNMPYHEEELKEKFSLSVDGRNNAIMTIPSIVDTDNAVYFCAASLHSAA
ncbi:HVM14 protein, partial [Amia calva]|nr:HVM14 protein [Amia calva]